MKYICPLSNRKKLKLKDNLNGTRQSAKEGYTHFMKSRGLKMSKRIALPGSLPMEE
jgi:hypothetical protein